MYFTDLKFIFIKNAASVAWIDILEVHWNQKAPIQKYISHKKEYEIDNLNEHLNILYIYKIYKDPPTNPILKICSKNSLCVWKWTLFPVLIW